MASESNLLRQALSLKSRLQFKVRKYDANLLNFPKPQKQNVSCLVKLTMIHCKNLYSASSRGVTQRRSQPLHDQIKPPSVERGTPEKGLYGVSGASKGCHPKLRAIHQ